MLQSSIVGGKPINCHRHRGEPATHICTELKCTHNSTLCSLCFRDQINRSYHYDHEKNVLPYAEAVDALCEQIKAETGPVQKIYKSTLGRSDFGSILGIVQKGQQIYEELQDKIVSIKGQIELELDLLVKEFQRLIVVEKQQYFKLLDNYKRLYTKNVDYLRAHSQTILEFNNSVKYYANKNNFYLKLNSEARKKSDWVSKAKKILFNAQKSIENSSFPSELTNMLASFHRQKLDNLPAWKGDENQNEKINEIKYLIKKALGQWIYIPDVKNLEEESEVGGHNVQAVGGKNYYY